MQILQSRTKGEYIHFAAGTHAMHKVVVMICIFIHKTKVMINFYVEITNL